jgi:hypothetical protein
MKQELVIHTPDASEVQKYSRFSKSGKTSSRIRPIDLQKLAKSPGTAIFCGDVERIPIIHLNGTKDTGAMVFNRAMQVYHIVARNHSSE